MCWKVTRIGTGKNLFKSVVKEGLPEEVSIVGEDNQQVSGGEGVQAGEQQMQRQSSMSFEKQKEGQVSGVSVLMTRWQDIKYLEVQNGIGGGGMTRMTWKAGQELRLFLLVVKSRTALGFSKTWIPSGLRQLPKNWPCI